MTSAKQALPARRSGTTEAFTLALNMANRQVPLRAQSRPSTRKMTQDGGLVRSFVRRHASQREAKMPSLIEKAIRKTITTGVMKLADFNRDRMA